MKNWSHPNRTFVLDGTSISRSKEFLLLVILYLSTPYADYTHVTVEINLYY